MKKHIFAIFAHPDDEAFGPSGTLLMEAGVGNQVHLICLTAGQAGANPDNYDDLAQVRLAEWQKAGKLMQATSQNYLGYTDNLLSNSLFHEIADKIEQIIKEVLKAAPKAEQIEFMSFDDNGISGHLDHIFATRLTAYLFYRLKATDKRTTKMRLLTLPRQFAPQPNTDYVYMSPGRLPEEIDEVVDATEYYYQIIKIMRAHHTQRFDCENHIKTRGQQIAVNYFLVWD